MLIVEDELTGRVLLREILKRYGSPQVVMNGKEAVDAVHAALGPASHSTSSASTS